MNPIRVFGHSPASPVDCADLCLRSGIPADAWAITAISCSSCALSLPLLLTLRAVDDTRLSFSVLARAVSRFLHLVRIACINELSNVSESVDHHQLITSFLRLTETI
ncbi:unnamed protein product [Alternaria burnsii]|nr:unnamed protein product [Alternaria burnsii]